MEAVVFWLSDYWRQVVGFAGAVVGTLLMLVLPTASSSWVWSLMCLAAAWHSAVLGTPMAGRPKDVMTPYYRYRVYWIGLVVFEIGCAIPIAWHLLLFGVRGLNVIAMAVMAFAAVVAVIKTWLDTRVDARNG